MTGWVVGHHPRIQVNFDTNAGVVGVEYVVDTGFEGALTLPVSAARAMGLSRAHQLTATLADGSQVAVDVYRATIEWNGNNIRVAVLGMGGRPLLGNALLEGSDLFIHYKDGGEVRIEPF
jgi:clan AA aspartic protease